jgi:Ca2+-binding RTX toxin-like protein
LIIDAANLFTTAAQLSGFTKIGVNNSSDQFHIFLQGAGGSLNFARSYTEPQRLTIEAESATSAVRINGSAGNNEIIGSDFADGLSGDRGHDTVRGGAGNDVVKGGLGKDHLFGDDGNDAFLFDSAAGSGNLDRLGDFRPVDDVIRLDDTVFKWTGQTLGALPSSAFKVIGNGQQVDANDHILYNENTGVIFYDVDGNKAGGAAAVSFALAENFAGSIPALTFQDFVIV